LAVTWNFTIDEGLELELDNMMTSFVGRRRRFAPTPTPPVTLDAFSSNARLLACRFSGRRSNDTSLLELGFGRSQNSLPTPTSLPVAVYRRRSPSRRKPHDNQSLAILASFPRFHSDTSSVALSSTWLHLLPPLVRHCHFTAPTA
jgi:hypothetical protein